MDTRTRRRTTGQRKRQPDMKSPRVALLLCVALVAALLTVTAAEVYCRECGIVFQDDAFLSRHMKAAHPGSSTAPSSSAGSGATSAPAGSASGASAAGAKSASSTGSSRAQTTVTGTDDDDFDLDLDEILRKPASSKPAPGSGGSTAGASAGSSAKSTASSSSSSDTGKTSKKPGLSSLGEDLLQSETFGRLALKRCKHGLLMYSPLDNTHGRALDTYGQYSEGEVEVFRQLVRHGDVVLDAGANVGMFTVFFGKAVGSSGQVHAFEPQRPLFHQLAGNVALNELDNVIVYPAALGAKRGTIALPAVDFTREGCHGCAKFDPSTASSSGRSTSGEAAGDRVRLMTVDALELPRLRLLKLDVNGMELEVINGARRTLQELQPVLYVSNTRDARSLEVVRTLDELGYTLYWSISPCFNEDNYFGQTRDVFHPFCAHVNMIGVHRDSDVNIVGDTNRVPVPPASARDARAVYGTMFDFMDSRGDGLGVLDNDDLFGTGAAARPARSGAGSYGSTGSAGAARAASAAAPSAGAKAARAPADVADVEAAAERALRDILGDEEDADDLDAILGTAGSAAAEKKPSAAPTRAEPPRESRAPPAGQSAGPSARSGSAGAGTGPSSTSARSGGSGSGSGTAAGTSSSGSSGSSSGKSASASTGSGRPAASTASAAASSAPPPPSSRSAAAREKPAATRPKSTQRGTGAADDLDAILGPEEDDEEDFDAWLDRIKRSLGV